MSLEVPFLHHSLYPLVVYVLSSCNLHLSVLLTFS